MGRHFVKVFGERNTGTRALIRMLGAQDSVTLRPEGVPAALNLAGNRGLRGQIDTMFTGKLRRQYHDAVLDMEHEGACPTLDWKHAAPRWGKGFVEHRAHVVFCVRDPYSWVISLAKHPYHRHEKVRNLAEFIERPWLTMRRDNLAPILVSPLELWNQKGRAYLRFRRGAEVPVEEIKFETFVEAPVQEVERVLNAFAIPFEVVREVAVSTKDAKTSYAEIAAEYRHCAWRRELTHDVVLAINERLDWDVADSFGYTRLHPEDFPKVAMSQVHDPPITSKSLSHTRSSTLHSGFQ